MGRRKRGHLKVPVNISMDLNHLDQIEGLIDQGSFGNRSEIVSKALNLLFDGQKQDISEVVSHFCDTMGIALVDGKVIYPDGREMKIEISKIYQKCIAFLQAMI